MARTGLDAFTDLSQRFVERFDNTGTGGTAAGLTMALRRVEVGVYITATKKRSRNNSDVEIPRYVRSASRRIPVSSGAGFSWIEEFDVSISVADARAAGVTGFPDESWSVVFTDPASTEQSIFPISKVERECGETLWRMTCRVDLGPRTS